MIKLPIAILITVTVINFLLAATVVKKNKKDSLGIAFTLFTLSVSSWSFINALFPFLKSSSVAYTLAIAAYVAAILIASSLAFFSFVFPDPRLTKTNIGKQYRLLIFLPTFLIILILLIFPKLILERVDIFDNSFKLVTNKFLIIYAVYLVIYFGFAISNLVRNFLYFDGIQKRQLKVILIGLSGSIFFGILFNLALPLVGIYEFVWLGPNFTLILVAALAYAIVKHRLLQTKILSTEILTGVILSVLFIQVLISKGFVDLLTRIGFFVLTSVAGYLLIKSVINEVDRREEIQQLSEDLTKANSRLQKLDKTKSEFLSIASHQLRTPISGIKGYLSMILEGDFGKIEEKPKEILKSIYDNTERLNGLVNDFLDVSRIERGKLTMERKSTDIAEMIQSIVSNFQPVADAKGLKLDYSPPKTSIPQVNVDPNKLRQVALNLVDNAFKYTGQGSIHVTLEGLKDRFRVCVKDTGVGLDPDEAKNLFRPFVRTADSSKSNATGSGLGLYVARKIVQYHGGKVWAESEGKGKGSTFCMEVPYDQSTLPEPEPEPYLE